MLIAFGSFPQHYAAASLKLFGIQILYPVVDGFPQHYAAASLKLPVGGKRYWKGWGFPQHYAAASLKLSDAAPPPVVTPAFSAALRCGLIEAANMV